jgi:hypothetical protein
LTFKFELSILKFRMGKIMTIFKILLAMVFISGIFIQTAHSQEPLSVACEPYGSVTINGAPASDNMLVIAYVGDIELARTSTEGGQYSLLIDLDDPDTPQREGYQPGDIINIRVNGNPATPAFEAFAGRHRRDIEVVSLGVRLETWGRIKALFK